jgi:hypothetical protein
MMRLGVVLAGLAVTVLTLAVSAWAAGPLHEKSTFSGSFTFAAGELCDFNYEQTFTVVDNALIYGDPENPDKVITQETQYVTHTNLDTGYSLSEVDHLVFTFTSADAHFKQVAMFWALRDASGKLVVQQAGQFVFNTDTGEVVTVTPHFDPDFAGVICPALGGNPA